MIVAFHRYPLICLGWEKSNRHSLKVSFWEHIQCTHYVKSHLAIEFKQRNLNLFANDQQPFIIAFSI